MSTTSTTSLLSLTARHAPRVRFSAFAGLGLGLSMALGLAACDDGTEVATGTGDESGAGTTMMTGTTSGGDSATGTTADGSTDAGTTGEDPVYPILDGPCNTRVAQPTRVVVTGTDGATGSVGLVDAVTGVVNSDLQAAEPDSAMAFDGQRVYVINRFMFDYVQVLASTNLAEHSLFKIMSGSDLSANPQDIAFDALGNGFVTSLGLPTVQAWNFANPALPQHYADIDLSAFADADGIPELGTAITCGSTLFVGAERLDRDNGWEPVDHQLLIPVRTTDGGLYDFVGNDGLPDGIRLLGRGQHGHVAAPGDATGHVILLLTTGVERIDLAAGTTQWAIPAAVFEAKGFGPFTLGDFAVAADGNTLYFSAANADWSGHSLWRATLSSAGADLVEVFPGLTTKTGAVRIVGNTLFFPDSGETTSGVRVFDLSSGAPIELGNSPIDTGLPPYGLMTI